ncbi:MAG: hypothetical protein AAGJ18_20015 [Bacteroidota bacterium]
MSAKWGFTIQDFDTRCQEGSIWNFSENRCKKLPEFEIITPTVVINEAAPVAEKAPIGMRILTGIIVVAILVFGYLAIKKKK